MFELWNYFNNLIFFFVWVYEWAISGIENARKDRLERMPKYVGNVDDFEKKLTKAVGKLQVDIYRTEPGEVTMQKQFANSNFSCY